MEQSNKKTPFSDLVNTLKEIRGKPLSQEQITKINSIIESNDDDLENVDPVKKIANSNESTESYQ